MIVIWIWSSRTPDAILPILNLRNASISAFGGTIIYDGPPNRSQEWTLYFPDNATNSLLDSPPILLIRCATFALFTAILPAIWLSLRLPPRIFNALAAISLILMAVPVVKMLRFRSTQRPTSLPSLVDKGNGIWEFNYHDPAIPWKYWEALLCMAILPAVWAVVSLLRRRTAKRGNGYNA